MKARELSILTLAVCMYLVSNYVMMPVDEILGIPSVVLVVGLFLGVLKGYPKYLLYAFSILSCIPEMYIEYEKSLITNRAFLEMYLKKLYDLDATPPTIAEPNIWMNILVIGFFALVFVYSVQYIYMNYIKLFSSLKLILVMLSLPVLLSILPYIVIVPLMFYSKLNFSNILLSSNVDILNWIVAISTVIRSIVVLIFGPIYGYFVFRTIGLYKRLGVQN